MKTFKALLIFSLTFLSIGILFEVLLTFGGIMVPLMEIDKEKGERYIANKTCNSMFIAEGFGLAKTNSYGWFGKEFTDRGDSDISIAVIGNSFVASRQIFYRNNFLSIAEQKLNDANLPMHTALFNFGKESVSVREALYIKEEVEKKFNPDHFLIVLNDSIFGPQGHYIPYYELKEGHLSLNSSFKESSFMKKYDAFKMLTKSSVVFLGYRVKNRIPQMSEILLDKFYFPKTRSVVHSDTSTYSSIDAVDSTIIAKLASDKRVIFLIDMSKGNRNKVKAIAKNAYIIDLYEPLQKLKDEGVNPYYWEVTDQVGHWNRYAHKVIGEEIAEKIVTLTNSGWSSK